MADVPHFDLPFRFFGNSAAVVEQDSLDDVANCIDAILSTPVGWRPEAPDFGIPELAFRNQPIGVPFLRQLVTGQDPRADIIARESPDILDSLIDNINIEVTTTGGGE